jgi:uncharacterized protein (DUF433 family)
MMQTQFTEIQSTPGIMSGTPVFKGTRVPFEALLDYLKAGESLEDFIDDFPTVSREQVIRALEEVMRNATKIAGENPS